MFCVLVIAFPGCKSKIEFHTSNAAAASASATSLKPITAKPGDIVSLTGTGFSARQKNLVKITTASGNEVRAPVTVTSDTAATFVMPEGAGLGLTSVVLESNGKQMTGAMSFVADLASNVLPILIDDVSEICSTKQYIDRNGDPQTGTKDCSGTFVDLSQLTSGNIKSGVTINGVTGTVNEAPSNCSSAGQQSCVATGTYFAGTACAANSSACYLPTYIVSTQPLKAISYDAINSSAASIRSGTTLGAVAGTLADCSTDGATGCVTTSSYKSADMTNVMAGNIKSGLTIAGQLGDFPSATYPLTGASATADLDAATFDAKVKSATAFEYWDSSGSRQTGAGDADIATGNIKDMVSIFGTNGNYAGAEPNAWDVRVGTVVNGVTGKLKVNCRNRARTSRYNYDGAGGSIPFTSVATGTSIDYWDTIDDVNNNVAGLPSDLVSGWTNFDCGGVEATADDANVWKDITTTGDGATASSCAANSAHCTMKDKITGLHWSKMANFSFTNSTTTNASATLVVSSTNGLVAGMVVAGTGIPGNTYILSVDSGSNLTMSANATASASNVTITVTTALWNGAVGYCDGLSYNGATDWRLPTLKELLEAHAHGVRSAASASWMSEANMSIYFWAATTHSTVGGSAWFVALDGGMTTNSLKTAARQVVCVR